jgi:transposase
VAGGCWSWRRLSGSGASTLSKRSRSRRSSRAEGVGQHGAQGAAFGRDLFEYAREVQPLPKLGSWRADLDRMLATNEAKSPRERLTLIRLFEGLSGLGYEGGYDAVRRYARTRRRARGAATAEAYVPLSFAPGEAYQLDWSPRGLVLNGVTTLVKVAHVRLCHSRMPFVRAYPRESNPLSRRGPVCQGVTTRIACRL